MKSYKIRTTTDIYKAVNADNINDFLKDFKGWLSQVILVKYVADSTGIKIAEAGFTWNDDKQPGVIKGINIEIKERDEAKDESTKHSL